MSEYTHNSSSSSTSRLDWKTSKNATGVNFEINIVKDSPYNSIPSINPPLSNWNAYVYDEIISTIDVMKKLPQGEPLALDPKVANRAQNILSFIREQLKINPPKILNQDGDAVVYTWVEEDKEYYLTVADDEVDLMKFYQDGTYHVEVLSQDESDLPYKKIMELMLLHPKTSSTNYDL